MLTIIYNTKKIYINIDLLKKRAKKAFIRLLKVLSVASLVAGFVWIIGTAGASDLELITFSEIITRILQGFLCCGVAWVLNFIKLVIE